MQCIGVVARGVLVVVLCLTMTDVPRCDLLHSAPPPHLAPATVCHAWLFSYEGPCYQLTSHLPSTATLCLAEVASISNDPLNPNASGSADVWGGPLANGDYAFGLVRAAPAAQFVILAASAAVALYGCSFGMGWWG
jgi:hypothetical protein